MCEPHRAASTEHGNLVEIDSRLQYASAHGTMKQRSEHSPNNGISGESSGSHRPAAELHDLSVAVFGMVHDSYWGLERFDSKKLLSDRGELANATLEAATLVWQAARDGRLIILSGRNYKRSVEPVPIEDWEYAVLDLKPDFSLVWGVAARPVDGDWTRENLAWRYEDLMVRALDFERLWPMDPSSTTTSEFLELPYDDDLF